MWKFLLRECNVGKAPFTGQVPQCSHRCSQPLRVLCRQKKLRSVSRVYIGMIFPVCSCTAFPVCLSSDGHCSQICDFVKLDQPSCGTFHGDGIIYYSATLQEPTSVHPYRCEGMLLIFFTRANPVLYRRAGTHLYVFTKVPLWIGPHWDALGMG